MKTIKAKTTILVGMFLYLSMSTKSQESYGEIRGIIKNTNLEVVSFATIKILQGTQFIGGTQTDERGRYLYKPLAAGKYEMIILSPEYQSQTIKGVIVEPNEASYVDIKMNVNTMETITVTAINSYTPPGVDKNMYSMVSVDYKELNVNANYVPGNLSTAIMGITSDVVQTNDGELHFRGSRGDASSNFVDGVRTYGQTTVPGLAIENLTVYTGGVPACYGDVTSGVVIINTKSYFSGIREKNIRIAENRERQEENKRVKKNKEDEENRIKEIEAEKKKQKENEKN